MKRRDLLMLAATGPLWMSRSVFAATQAADIPGKISSNRHPHASACLRKLIADDQFPGAVLMINRRGQPDHVETVGWLDGEHKTEMPHDGIFFLASLSKPVTAVATICLMEQGKIRLDDSVEQWLPELANRKVLKKPDGPLDDTYPSPRAITVADLLAFRCGYGSNGAQGPFGAAQRAANTSPNRAQTLEPGEFLQQLNPIPLQYAPGEHWLYDVPADILGVLIERVSGLRFSVFLKKNIFDPLGMKDTGFFASPEKLSRVAQYPAGIKADTALTTDPRFESGAHGMVSTADDYMRFTRMLLNKGELNGVRIIKSSNVDAMCVDRLSPDEHQAGGFLQRYPGRGFGWCGAVRQQALAIGPSVGSYNWAGGSGVWMMVDFARQMATVLMVQHPTGGPLPPGPEQPISREAQAMANASVPVAGSTVPAKKYLAQTVWNDLIQTEIYRDVVDVV